MLAVWRKPPGEEPEGSRPSATSLVVHVVLSRTTLYRMSPLDAAPGSRGRNW
ncbi:MAG TPA: DUF1584 domain-containing protein [Rhodopirellula baltica]|nr:DUF1584 domain-containing protein [Rhodopirellula baltica]